MAVLVGREAREYRELFEDFYGILDYDLGEDELLALHEMLSDMLALVDARIVEEMRQNSPMFDAKTGVKWVII